MKSESQHNSENYSEMSEGMRLLHAVEIAIKQRRYPNKSQLLADAGVNKNFFGDIRSGNSKTPNQESIQKISELAGINLDFVYFGREPVLMPGYSTSYRSTYRPKTYPSELAMAEEPLISYQQNDEYSETIRETVLTLRSVLSSDDPRLANDHELNQQLVRLLDILLTRLLKDHS